MDMVGKESIMGGKSEEVERKGLHKYRVLGTYGHIDGEYNSY